MRPGPNRLLRVLGGAVAALVMVVASGPNGQAVAAATPAASSTALVTPFCPPARPGHKACLGLALKSSVRRPLATRPGAAATTAPGFTPQDLQAAYGLTATASTNGANQTIALVEAFHDPNAASDLATYRAAFGLQPCTTASGCFRQVDLSNGGGQTDPGWEEETSLDMDAVSAACPLCHILVVESIDDADSHLIAAVRQASSLGATVMNLSFGGCEGGAGSGSYDSALQSSGLPITVSTGDSGYYATDNPGCTAGTPQYPASSPDVTAVGGTSLYKGGGGSRGWSETAWQYSVDPRNGPQAGGSGCSSFEPKPTWQSDAGCATHRTVADVSADADPNTGIPVYVSDPNAVGGWAEFGGTSLAAPLIAGIYALAGSPPAAIDGQLWYAPGAVLNDVTSGTNAASPTDCNPSPYLCNAGSGYDGPTGMGTPNGAPIINPSMTPLSSPSSSTAVPLSWSPPPTIHAASYQVWEQDVTTGSAWLAYNSTTATSTTFYGFRGHQYNFGVQYFTANRSTNGPPTAAASTTTVAPNASLAPGFTGMYAVDGYGTLHPASSPPLPVTFGWAGWDIIRGIAPSPTGEGGVVLDGWGGLHPFGDSSTSINSPGYWPGWDIIRGAAALPAASSTQWSGYLLDGFGGLHGFSVGGGALPPTVSGNAYWGGWSIARGLATFSDGSGGVVLDGWGGVHAFAVGSHAQPAAAVTSAYWPGWDIARAVVLLPGSTSTSYSGYVLDGWGGLHPFASTGTAMPPSINSPGYWPGWDIARSVVLDPAPSSGGYVVDGYGGFHQFGGAPAVITPNYGANGWLVRGTSSA